jgi:GNAT superfamily N-acetyltransferase
VNNTATTVHEARTADEILHCRDTMLVLRERFDPEQFVPTVQRMQAQGFRLAYIEDAGGRAVCVAGYRYEEMLHRGPSMYIDDLVTLPECRSKGYGGSMLDWLFEQAKANGCRQVHLDSGVQRFDAHRFYLRKGFRIASHHFVADLDGRTA